MHWGAKPGMRVGILGMGGLGMMGVKLAKALGCGALSQWITCNHTVPCMDH